MRRASDAAVGARADPAAPRHPHAATSGRTLRVTRRYAAAPAKVFAAWLDEHRVGGWLFATATRPMKQVRVEPRVGGAFHLAEADGAAPYTGRYLEIVPDRRVVFTFAGPPRPPRGGRVSVELAPRGRGCALTLTHEDVPRGEAAHARGRWSGILYGLDLMLRD